MDKYLCERCGKELNFRCAYSRIDHKLICVECDDKEQPKELAKKIADLEAKLAEKDQAIESLQEINQSLGQTCNNDAKEIERLREKENLLNLIVDGYYTPTNIVERQIREQNQTAIAELEKVKELIKEHYNKQFPDFPLGVTEQIHIGIIDQRIKSLKGESR